MAVKGIKLTLGDGKEYVIAPLLLGALEDMQESISSVGDGLDPDTIRTMIDTAHSSLLRNYPDMTREDVRQLLDVANMADVFEACMDMSGMKRKAIEAEAEAGAGEA